MQQLKYGLIFFKDTKTDLICNVFNNRPYLLQSCIEDIEMFQKYIPGEFYIGELKESYEELLQNKKYNTLLLETKYEHNPFNSKYSKVNYFRIGIMFKSDPLYEETQYCQSI